jgi:two-component system response regulator
MIKTMEVDMKGEPLNILLVEDDASHAELVIEGLRGHRVANSIFHVTTGKDALDYLFRENDYSDPESSPRPHIILLDLRLPKVDGLEVLKRIKENELLHSIPVVVLTSSDADRDIQRAYELNANSYLVKPVDFLDFTKMLETLGYYWLAWNESEQAEAGM